jgi:GNAT superfamily N-acetyltransferase
MPTLQIYPQTEFPSIFKWQAIAFMRCEWSDIFQGENLYMTQTYPPENKPIHFVLSEGETLISYAAVMEVSLAHAGSDYHIYGFGNMLTFPPFRKHGYGRQILSAATDFIRTSNADAGILFCDPSLESFYAADGWRRAHSPTRLGKPDHYEVYQPSRMMLFVSERGLAHKKDFDLEPLYVDWPW